jgi:hypothetical protein
MANVELEWWWPSPEAFDDLTVTDIEEGWQLSAPDDTELAEWLSYWSQDEEHHALFQKVFVKALTDHAEFVLNDLETNGKNEDVPVGGQTDREQAEEHLAGELP